MLRRLSEPEYNKTLLDVFGADAKSWQTIQFVGDLRQSGSFATLSSALGANPPWMSALVDSTFDRAQSMLAGTPSILVAPCTATLMDATCATAMVKAYGYRLFRRPVTDAEVAPTTSPSTTEATLGAPEDVAERRARGHARGAHAVAEHALRS